MNGGWDRKFQRLPGLLGLLGLLLVVGCGSGGSGDDDLLFTSSTPPDVSPQAGGDRQPVAEAGLNRQVTVATPVILDGSASSPVEGDLSFDWTILEKPPGSAAFLDDPQAETPSFIPDAEGSFLVQLVVCDGVTTSKPDLILIIVTREEKKENLRPVALAGPDIRVPVFSLVTLHGEESFDPEGEPLAFEWAIVRQPAGSALFLSGAQTATPQFTPLTEGDYQVLLTVRDREGNLDADLVTVTAVPAGTGITPQADAGLDRVARVDEVVRLDGSGSFDPQGELLVFDWRFVSRPQGSFAILAEANTATPFFIPDVVGDYLVQLTVRDPRGGSSTESVTVTVLPANSLLPPLADQASFISSR